MHACVYRVRLRGFGKCFFVAYGLPMILITEQNGQFPLQSWVKLSLWAGTLASETFILNYVFSCNALFAAPHIVLCSLYPRLTVFFSACPRVKGCVSPSLYTCHLLNLMTRTLKIHLKMTMMMMTRTRLRRTSQTGHQWVHLSAHCLQSLLSLLFLSVKGSKTTHIKRSPE